MGWHGGPYSHPILSPISYGYSGDTFGDVTSHGAIVHGDDDEIAVT